MANGIKVQGERYANLDDLREAIGDLHEKLEGLPEGSPEHTDLARHVERLQAAADESGEGTGVALPEPDAEPSPELPPEAEPEEEPAQTHSLREAADTGAEVICPLCGSDIPFPESPPIDAFASKCDKCDGWGTVLTGSRVDGHIWRDCKKCNGAGFVEKGAPDSAQPFTGAAQTPEAPGAVWNPDTQRWNPPVGAQPPWSGAQWDELLGKWS